MKKLLFIIIITSLIIISGCTGQKEPVSNFPNGDVEDTNPIADLIPKKIEINYNEVERNFKLEETHFIKTPTDIFGDESSFNRIKGTTSFEVATQIVLTYQSNELLKGINIPLTIVDTVAEKTIYEGTLLEGTNNYDVIFQINHAGMSPRFQACFGEDVCVQLRGSTVDNSLTTNLNSISYNIERGTTTKKIILSNEGTTYITAFVYLPEGDDFTLNVDKEIVTLAPNTETTITITASGTRSNGKEYGSVYALPHNCNIDEECAASGKIKNELTISFN